MEGAGEKLLPGVSTTFIGQDGKGFSNIELMISATGGLSLSQVCAVTGLEGTTIQNWVKRGWVAHPKGKKYEQVHIARILIINALKECIKLEQITMLMNYVSGLAEDGSGCGIKECDLFRYLCEALRIIDQVEDISRFGVEAVADEVIRDYEGPTSEAQDKIRKALIVMIYACVSVNVKRRTELMMGQIMREIKGERTEILAEKRAERSFQIATQSAAKREPRKTVSQALREWDQSVAEMPETKNEDIAPAAPKPVVQKQPASMVKPAEKPAGKRTNKPEEPPAFKPVYFGKS